MSRRRRRKARWRVPSWLQLSASRPRLGGGRAQWHRPPPLCKGPDRGRRVHEQPPLFLEFMQALTPHFHWIAEREHCGLWTVAKRVDLWLNRVFDTAEDFRLRGALPALLSALRALHPDAWEACLHINTSPIPRFMGGFEDAILDRGLGPVGTHQLPKDLWDAVVPPFYREGLRDFDVEREWQDGDKVVRGATRWVSQQVQRIVQALRGAGVYEATADPPPPPTCYPFVIPKSSEKVSLILSCVKINKSDGPKPPSFGLDSWEDLARSLSAFPLGVGLYGVHIDLKNAFWSFCLPQGARQVFRFRSAPGAPPVALSRLPFGWKYSPYLCQTSLARILGGVLPPEILLVHYLDDFVLVFTDREVLREAGRSAVRALIEAGFLISPKSVLDPVPVASFLGKELALQVRQIKSHEQALLQLWAGWLRLAVGTGNDRHLQSFLGLLNWHVRPRGFGCPFAAGAYCWLRWDRMVGGVKQPAQGFPLKMLGSLATLMAVAAEPWQAPGGVAWRQLKTLQFGSEDRLTNSSLWYGGVIICVDGARDAGCWRVGALVPGVGVRTHVTPPARFASQQTTELRGLAWAVRFAVRTGHKSVTVCSDSEAAIAHVLRLRATSHLTHHRAVLRSLARILWVSGIVVRLVWVPSALQPGDPMSRVTSMFGGSQARAEVEAWRTWDALLDNLGEARVRGVVCLRGC